MGVADAGSARSAADTRVAGEMADRSPTPPFRTHLVRSWRVLQAHGSSGTPSAQKLGGVMTNRMRAVPGPGFSLRCGTRLE